MFKNLSPTVKLFGGLILVVIIVMVIMMSISGNQVSKSQLAHYVNDNASADNKVEALKTMTADLIAVQNRNQQLEESIVDLKTQDQQVASQLKNSLSTQLQKALEKLQKQNQKSQHQLSALEKIKFNQSDHAYTIQGDNAKSAMDGGFVWISDISKQATIKAVIAATNKASSTDSLLHSSNEETTNNALKIPIKPMYTIPDNATLTGATLMTPLVGRVPIDGQLPSPYHFKLVLSAKNLTANGYPLPGIKGAVMSGVASGDMLASCARGNITSITFIFNDGRISNTQAKGQDDSLGYISSISGNPCIAGTFHSNAAIFLGAKMGLAGVEGYANAIASSQYSHTVSPTGETISALIGSANKAGASTGISAASQAAQTWWNQRVKNSFDYVYVPNTNKRTGRVMKVAVNISKQIDINYNPIARKVNYENTLSLFNHELD